MEMASTPVSAVDPDEKACNITNSPTPAAVPIGASSERVGRTAWAQPENAHLVRATATRT